MGPTVEWIAMGRLLPLRHRRRLPIFALLGANAVSMVGDMMTMVAVPWFVLQTTGSATKTALRAPPSRRARCLRVSLVGR